MTHHHNCTARTGRKSLAQMGSRETAVEGRHQVAGNSVDKVNKVVLRGVAGTLAVVEGTETVAVVMVVTTLAVAASGTAAVVVVVVVVVLRFDQAVGSMNHAGEWA